jgi:hypothetical protein
MGKINLCGTEINLVVLDNIPPGKAVFVSNLKHIPASMIKDKELIEPLDITKLQKDGFIDVQVIEIPKLF